MARQARRTHDPAFEMKLALAALKDEEKLAELATMRRIDELRLNYPLAGGRMLPAEVFAIGRQLVATQMRQIRAEAILWRANTHRTAARRNCRSENSWPQECSKVP